MAGTTGAIARGRGPFPRTGRFSRMAVPTFAVVMVVVIGLGLPGIGAVFAGAITPPLAEALMITFALMGLHKLECYGSREWERSPFYLRAATLYDDEPGRGYFLAFAPAVVMLLFCAGLLVAPAPWPLLSLLVWLAQGLHELHHLGKAAAERRHYPGVVSAVLFVLVMDGLFLPRWLECVDLPGSAATVYLGLQPVLIVIFFLEHRDWRRRHAAWVEAAQTDR